MILNAGNSTFKRGLKADYVDKSMFIAYVNSFVDSEEFCLCVSRGRRFGKSLTAKMLNAYYSKGADSKSIFDNLEISKDPSYLENLNKYDVMYFDMQAYGKKDEDGSYFLNNLNQAVIESLKKSYPSELKDQDFSCMEDAISFAYEVLDSKFIVIIDEWDFVFRNYPNNQKLQEDYIDLLSSLFKETQMSDCFSLVYMTGILPIKRYSDQSKLNNFFELSMLYTAGMGKYFGFTPSEVQALCQKHNIDFEKTKYWYDGYRLDGEDIYNPQAIKYLIKNHGIFQDFWTKTASMDAVYDCIGRNFDGVKESIIDLVAGNSLTNVNFNNPHLDPNNFCKRDDVLIYMIYLCYLAYDKQTHSVYVPNNEVRENLRESLDELKWPLYEETLKISDELLQATLDKDCDKVASIIASIHNKYSSFIDYATESSIKHATLLGYLSALKTYDEPKLEAKGGLGYADVVFTPNPAKGIGKPALIIEFKKDKSAEVALKQIIDKGYIDAVKGTSKKALLIGVSFDSKTKEHSCVINEIDL